MATTFKVGDRVQVKTWDEMVEEFGKDECGDTGLHGEFMADMKYMCGETATITHIGSSLYDLAFSDSKIEQNPWGISIDMLKPITEEEKIITIRDGNKTIAKHYIGKELVKTGVARCHPNDTYSFAVGSKIANDRLWGGDTEKARRELLNAANALYGTEVTPKKRPTSEDVIAEVQEVLSQAEQELAAPNIKTILEGQLLLLNDRFKDVFNRGGRVEDLILISDQIIKLSEASLRCFC